MSMDRNMCIEQTLRLKDIDRICLTLSTVFGAHNLHLFVEIIKKSNKK